MARVRWLSLGKNDRIDSPSNSAFPLIDFPLTAPDCRCKIFRYFFFVSHSGFKVTRYFTGAQRYGSTRLRRLAILYIRFISFLDHDSRGVGDRHRCFSEPGVRRSIRILYSAQSYSHGFVRYLFKFHFHDNEHRRGDDRQLHLEYFSGRRFLD